MLKKIIVSLILISSFINCSDKGRSENATAKPLLPEKFNRESNSTCCRSINDRVSRWRATVIKKSKVEYGIADECLIYACACCCPFVGEKFFGLLKK